MYGCREIGLSEWQAARSPIEHRVTQAKKWLARISRTTALAGHVGNASGLREQWPNLPLTRQHAIVAALLDHVLVGPGRPGINRSSPAGSSRSGESDPSAGRLASPAALRPDGAPSSPATRDSTAGSFT